MNHEDIEKLSAFLDHQVSDEERRRIEGHLESCPECAAIRSALARAAGALASLPQVNPDPDEARAIRTAILERRRRRPVFAGARLWALSGSIAGLLLITVAVAVVRDRGVERASAPALVGAPADFATEEEVRSTVLGDPRIQDGLRRYRLSDVGERQAQVAQALAPEDEAPAAESAEGDGQPQAQDQTRGTQRSLAFCLRSVMRSITYPVMPLAARPATFKGQVAWLLVFAYTTSTDEDAPLDRLQIWVVDRLECFPLNIQSRS